MCTCLVATPVPCPGAFPALPHCPGTVHGAENAGYVAPPASPPPAQRQLPAGAPTPRHPHIQPHPHARPRPPPAPTSAGSVGTMVAIFHTPSELPRLGAFTMVSCCHSCTRHDTTQHADLLGCHYTPHPD